MKINKYCVLHSYCVLVNKLNENERRIFKRNIFFQENVNRMPNKNAFNFVSKTA